MKTPRELMLERHRQAQSKLDAIRRATLAGMNAAELERSSFSLRDVLHSLRWHLAGISAVWLFVLFLHLETQPAPQMTASIPPAKTSSPQVIMASFRENRRQLAEMIGLPEKEPRALPLPKPRSERCRAMLMA